VNVLVKTAAKHGCDFDGLQVSEVTNAKRSWWRIW
jgi:hypothetical protein